jgi:hypothetical protein
MNSTATLPSPPEPFGTATAVLGEGGGDSGGADIASGLAGTKGAALLVDVNGTGAGASGGGMGAGAVPCSSRRVVVGSSVVHVHTANTTAAAAAAASSWKSKQQTRTMQRSLASLFYEQFQKTAACCWPWLHIQVGARHGEAALLHFNTAGRASTHDDSPRGDTPYMPIRRTRYTYLATPAVYAVLHAYY